jgi:hypothetical protein
MALSTKLYDHLFVYFAEALGKERIMNSRTKNIIAIINCMQYKKNKKIEATRPFLCGGKNSPDGEFFFKVAKKIKIEFLSCQISKKNQIKKNARFYPKFQQVAKI